MKGPIDWRLFWFLFIASVLSVISVLPYTLTLQAGLMEQIPISLHILLPAQILLNAILFAVFIYVGLRLSAQLGLGAPLLEGWLSGRDMKDELRSILGVSIALGVLAGFVIIGFDVLFYIFGEGVAIGQISPTLVSPPIWMSFLASFYGGIGEEVAMRLFIMTLLVWVFHRIEKRGGGGPSERSLWLAIVIAAILFGAGHLPAALPLIEPTSPAILRIVLLNSIGGVIFGWLYWRKGLESAMISHFSADMVLHVLLPLFL